MTFYIKFTILVLFLYSIYLNSKLRWLVEIRMFIYKQCEEYVKNLMDKNIQKLNTQEDLSKEFKKIEETTLALTISKLRLRSFYSVLLNPFNNNIYSNVKNKIVLYNILKDNGFYS